VKKINYFFNYGLGTYALNTRSRLEKKGWNFIFLLKMPPLKFKLRCVSTASSKLLLPWGLSILIKEWFLEPWVKLWWNINQFHIL
jgi:hypothetical protein